MKVVVFGCQQIAVDFIKYLVTLEDVEIPLIVTYELPMDKTYGYKSLLEESNALNLNVINPSRITDKTIKLIKQIKPDIIFSIYYRKIFPNRLLSIPKLGCVNVHPSLLPNYRGPVPTAWAIMNGEDKTGVTIHLMDRGIDTGNILVQKEFKIYKDETGYELYTRAMRIGAELLKENFYKIIQQEIIPKQQIGSGSYYGRMKSKYIIDWQQKAENIRNLIRTRAKPYNPAETLLYNHYILINKASVINDNRYVMQGSGKVVDILDNNKLVVSCIDKCLLLEDYEIIPALTEIEKDVYLKIGNILK